MQDKTMPKGKWEFNNDVAEVFDDMLQRSIPEYNLMRELVKRIGCQYVKPNKYIVDVGCSNGNAIYPFIKTYGDFCKYMLLDVSEPMLEKCKERYEDYGCVEVMNLDVIHGLPKIKASVVLSVLTLQFTPIEYRQKILQSIYDVMEEGGAFILVEKVLGNTYEIDEIMVNEYYRIKSENQYTQEQIQAKRESLEGVLVPITARWNEELLKETGFKKIDCFWRCLNFAGWLAIK